MCLYHCVNQLRGKLLFQNSSGIILPTLKKEDLLPFGCDKWVKRVTSLCDTHLINARVGYASRGTIVSAK